MNQPWWVYIVQTRSGKFYTGISTDIERRFSEHCNPENAKRAKFFRSDPAQSIVYCEAVKNRSEASKREAAIKKLSRQKKCDLVEFDPSL
ncbi:MAG: GIY-YIG nuclease family protein [Pseudomonadales bacterium]